MYKQTLVILLGILVCSMALRMTTTRPPKPSKKYIDFSPIVPPSDAVYNGYCKPNIDSIPETCSSNKKVEYEWKSALSCGWYNAYNVYQIGIKAIGDIEGLTNNLKDVTCIASTIAFKNGMSLCNMFGTNLVLLAYSSVCKGFSIEKIFNMAEDGVQLRSPTFDARRDCPSFFAPGFDVEEYAMATLGYLEDLYG